MAANRTPVAAIAGRAYRLEIFHALPVLDGVCGICRIAIERTHDAPEVGCNSARRAEAALPIGTEEVAVKHPQPREVEG
jgi:hypothetical protein